MSEYVIVRREPTQEMCAAAVIYANGNAVYKNVAAEALKIEEGIYGEAFEAMCAASPRPQSVLTDGEILSALRPLYGSEEAAAMASLMDIADARAIESAVLRKLGGE